MPGLQAARGTSLNPADEPTEANEATEATGPIGAGGAAGQVARPRRSRRLGLLAAVAGVAYALDVATKVLAVARLDATSNVEVVGPWLTLTLVRNPGAAFSTGTEFTIVLSLISITAALVVLWVARRVGSTGWAVGLGLLLAGVLGNLTDRVLRQPGPLEGHVIDFFRLPNWPVFNIADICINIAAALILVQAFRGIRVDGTRESDHAAASGDEPDGPDAAGEPADRSVDQPADVDPGHRG